MPIMCFYSNITLLPNKPLKQIKYFSLLMDMALEGSSTLPTSDGKPEVVRKLAEFHPSAWGDHFVTYSEDGKVDAWAKRIEELKQEVKNMLANAKGSVQEMNLIDALQRLGVAYHFENEIEEELNSMYDEYTAVNYDDLHTVALRFRLLRQEGYNVSSDVFIKFKDNQGNFRETLSCDTKGLLGLYEAAYLGTTGEDILDEAIMFTSSHLKSLMAHLDHPLAMQVSHALELPLRKCIQRLEARHYISVYEDEEGWKEVLLELAKLDFNVVQSLYQKEIKEISMWWKDINVAQNLPYVRDRLVEAYFWMMSTNFEPQYSRARMIMTKVFCIISIIDDTYDAYATLEELEPLTDAIQRWDAGPIDQMPDIIKTCFQVMVKTMVEIEKELTPEERSYRIAFLKETIKEMARVYLVEAHWFHGGHIPTLDEYLDIALISAGYYFLTVTSFVGMGEIVTKEAFEWAISKPKLLYAASIVCRIMDDIRSSKFEQKRGHVSSALECYMNEKGVTEQEACEKLQEMVQIAWKGINQECLRPTSLPQTLFKRVVNLSRAIEVFYMDGDGYTHSSSKTKAQITEVLVDPIPI